MPRSSTWALRWPTGRRPDPGWPQPAKRELEQGLEVLNRALHAFRLVTANPYVNAVARDQALVARVGFGAGEQVADGLWTEAHELIQPTGRRRRFRALQPQARLAAVLGGRERVLACQELTLRSRLDLDHGLAREAALQLLVALDAALAELPADESAPALAERLAELRERRDAVTRAAQAALSGPLGDADRQTVEADAGTDRGCAEGARRGPELGAAAAGPPADRSGARGRSGGPEPSAALTGCARGRPDAPAQGRDGGRGEPARSNAHNATHLRPGQGCVALRAPWRASCDTPLKRPEGVSRYARNPGAPGPRRPRRRADAAWPSAALRPPPAARAAARGRPPALPRRRPSPRRRSSPPRRAPGARDASGLAPRPSRPA